MRPLRFSVLVVLFVLLLSIAFAVEPVFATPIEDPENHPPVAAASIQEDHEDLWTNMSLHFSSVGSYDIDGEGRISFTWNFDDGTDPSILANPIHVYEDPGTYTVRLTVIDAKNVIDTDSLVLTVQRSYGDTDIIIRAVDPHTLRTYFDPPKDDIVHVAVKRHGWVAYRCDLKAYDEIFVRITIIGDHPADVYLFKEADFQTYKDNPQVNSVPSEAEGSEQGALGEFKYSFKPRDTDRYYIVIDNKDWPMGTDTEGPVDYTISIKPNWITEGHPLDGDPDYLWIILGTFAIIAVFAVVLIWKDIHRGREI